MCSYDHAGDRKDQKTLERLHAERQEKIDELKEKTNYYTTQQLIQVTIINCCCICIVMFSLGFTLGFWFYPKVSSMVGS